MIVQNIGYRRRVPTRLAVAIFLVLGLGCVQRMREAVEPTPPAGTGTLTCRQIVETCDRECTDPLCVRSCGDQGTAEAAALHNAVVDCAQTHGCMDEACIRERCGAEADACQGPEPLGEPVQAEPAPAPVDGGAAPGQVPP